MYGLLLDTDNDAATGCGVAVDDATVGAITFPGAERLVIVTVARTGTDGTVSGITVQDCVSGTTFGPPQAVSGGGWPVGKGNGVGGADVIEGFVSSAMLGNGNLVRVAFTASRGAVPNSDVMLSTTGELNGQPIYLRLPFHTPVPLLSRAALAVSIALLGGVAWWALRRRARSQRALLLVLALTTSMLATAVALTIVLDGQVFDWGTLAPVATDATGDSTLHDPAEDLVAGFLTADGTNLYLLMDVVSIAACVKGGLFLSRRPVELQRHLCRPGHRSEQLRAVRLPVPRGRVVRDRAMHLSGRHGELHGHLRRPGHRPESLRQLHDPVPRGALCVTGACS